MNGWPGTGSALAEMRSSAARSSEPPPLYACTDAPAGRRTDDGGIRSAGGEDEGGRREEGRLSLTSSVRRRGAVTHERKERERTKRYSALGFVSNRFRRVRGPKRVTQWLEFGSVPGEFGPNSGLNFYTLPNAGIRVRILEFRILSPILCIQTELGILLLNGLGYRSKHGFHWSHCLGVK
jgi:hypothetical protein